MGPIRLFLACAVFAEHFQEQVLAQFGMSIKLGWFLDINGGRAVLLFYIISGFLMSFVLHEKYKPNGADTIAFFRSRFLRIYPLWWLTLLGAIALAAWQGSRASLPSNWFPAIVLVGLDWIIPLAKFPDFDWSVLPVRTGIAWTLGAEVTFYLMAPVVLRSNRLALACLLASAAVRTAMLILVPRGPGFTNLTMFFFPATLMFFLLGHFAAVIWRARPLGLAASLALLVAAFAVSFFIPNDVTFDHWYSHLLPVCFALALPGIFAATMDSRFLNFLGDLTYPLYLTHSLAIAAVFWRLKDVWFSSWIDPLFQSKAVAPILAIGLVIVVLVAIGIHFLVEPVARAIMSRLIDLPLRLISARSSPAAQPHSQR